MQELNIEKFDPRKAELVTLVENVKKTVISMPGDKSGYALMKENKKILQKERTAIIKDFKDERSIARAYAEKILDVQKDFLKIIEPVETDLDEKIKEIDEEKERKSRLNFLPNRRLDLNMIESKITDEEVLTMDDKQYSEFYLNEKALYLDNKEEEARLRKGEEDRKLQEEKDKLEADKKKLEDDRKLQEAKEKAVEDAKAQARLDAIAETERVAKERDDAARKAEQDKKDAVEAEKVKAAKEKQDLIDEQESKEKARLDEIEQDKAIRAELEAKKKEQEKKLNEEKRYQEFLVSNGYTEKTKDQFHTHTENGYITLYQVVAKYSLLNKE